MSTRKLKFTGTVTAKGKTFEAGDEVPDDPKAAGIDMERMKRLGLVSASGESAA